MPLKDVTTEQIDALVAACAETTVLRRFPQLSRLLLTNADKFAEAASRYENSNGVFALSVASMVVDLLEAANGGE